jgi:hypothetical protein
MNRFLFRDHTAFVTPSTGPTSAGRTPKTEQKYPFGVTLIALTLFCSAVWAGIIQLF